MSEPAGQPRVSVIVPTWERPELCERAVRSALAQTLPPVQVLVWDDGSSPETRRRLRELAGRHPGVSLHEGEHTGAPAVGRNRLIELARGDWVALLDDDDEWQPGKLAHQRESMGDWDVIGSAAQRRSDGAVYAPAVGPVGRNAIARDNPLVLSTVMVRRSLALRGFREDRDLAGFEDYCLWLDLADAGARIVVTPEVVAVYDDTTPHRLSNASDVQARLARHVRSRWRRSPFDRDAAVAAAVHSSRATKLRVRAIVSR